MFSSVAGCVLLCLKTLWVVVGIVLPVAFNINSQQQNVFTCAMQWGLALSGWSIPFTSHHPDWGCQICHDVFFWYEAKQRQQDLPGNWSEGYRIQLKMFLGVHVWAQKLNESWFNFSCTFSQFHSNSMSWCQPRINPNCTVWISGSCVTVWHRMLFIRAIEAVALYVFSS